MATTVKTKTRKHYGSKWIRPEKRLAIYIRDNFTCVYCGLDLKNLISMRVTLDHVIPRSHGGGNNRKNLITACNTCNSARGNKKISQWADSSTKAAIKRQTRRSLKRPLAIAKSILKNK